MWKNLLIGSLSICCLMLNGQVTIDSLQKQLKETNEDSTKAKLYLKIGEKISRSKPEESLLYLDSSKMKLRSNSKLHSAILYNEGLAYSSMLKYDTAIIILDKAIEGLKESKDSFRLGRIYGELGKIYGRRGIFNSSIENLLNAVKIQKQIGDSTALASNLNGLGIVHKNLKKYDLARNYLNEAMVIFKIINQKSGEISTLTNIAAINDLQGNVDEAIQGYYDIIEMAKGNKRYEQLLAIAHNNIGMAYKKTDRLNEAYEAFQEAYAMLKKGSGSREELAILSNMATVAYDIGKTSKSQEYLNLYVGPAEEQKMFDGLLQAYVLKSKMAKDKNDADLSYQNMVQAMAYKDSLNNRMRADVTLELSAKYENEKKEQEIALLNAEKELAATKLTAARRQTYGLLGGLLLISGLLFSVFRLYRKTQSQNTIISKALSEKEILLREIHHRVKNNLQFISSLLGLQTEHVQDKVALGALEEGQNRVQSMALIHQNLYQEDNLTGVDMKQYFTKLTRGLFDSYNIRKGQITLNLNIEDVNLDVDTVIPIGLIVNELVSNSLKYAFPGDRQGVITVGLKEEDSALLLQVSDDGIGISENAKETLGKSFGYRLVNVFKDQLQAELSIDGSDGTLVEMIINKYDKT